MALPIGRDGVHDLLAVDGAGRVSDGRRLGIDLAAILVRILRAVDRALRSAEVDPFAAMLVERVRIDLLAGERTRRVAEESSRKRLHFFARLFRNLLDDLTVDGLDRFDAATGEGQSQNGQSQGAEFHDGSGVQNYWLRIESATMVRFWASSMCTVPATTTSLRWFKPWKPLMVQGPGAPFSWNSTSVVPRLTSTGSAQQ